MSHIATHQHAAAPDRTPGRPAFDDRLAPIAEKVRAGRRLSREDGLRLFDSPDIWTVCSLADLVRRRLHGDVGYYNVNRHLNYTNICALSCRFCGFYRKKGQDGAYEYSLDQIRDEARQAAEAGATELHIVGGLHPWLPFDYYLNMMRVIRQTAPQVHIKAFTAVEIVHLARIAGRGREGRDGIRSVLRELKDAGLGSLPGGGAEVFDDRVHDAAFKGKIRADQWLDVHRTAHDLGLSTNATILYGHVEQRQDRVNHLMRLRQEQDRALRQWAAGQGIPLQRTARPDSEEDEAVVLSGPDEMYPQARLPGVLPGGSGFFQAIIPLPFFPAGSALAHLPAPTGLENLRTLAIARLMLDNVPHVKAFWIMQTLNMAQFMLQNGADDIDGTVVWYDITKLKGPTTHQEAGVWDLQRAIREAGFRPVERDTLYRPIVREGRTWRIVAG